MRTPFHSTRPLLLILASALLALGSCKSATSGVGQHWSVDSLGARVSKAFLGFDEERDVSYREMQWQDKQDINLTLRRHFLNSNPWNPFQPLDASIVAPRPPHSIVPDPVDYFHIESVMSGLLILASSGTFIPIPIGSLIATVEDGGVVEFGQGISNTLKGNFRPGIGTPPPVSAFRVHNP